MKIGLNVGERMLTLAQLPQEGSFVTLKMIRGLVERIGMKPEEITLFEVKEADGQIMWNRAGMEPIEYEFADAEIEIIAKSLKQKDTEGKLRQEMLPVYEKFVR